MTYIGDLTYTSTLSIGDVDGLTALHENSSPRDGVSPVVAYLKRAGKVLSFSKHTLYG
jgi:hypothetical protein